MLGLEKFRIYLQHGKYYPAVVFLKACPQSQRVGKGLHLVFRAKRTELIAVSVHSVCLEEVLYVAFSTLC